MTNNTTFRRLKLGDIVTIAWGNQRCVVRVVRPAGTVDVESLDTGRWYRISGVVVE